VTGQLAGERTGRVATGVAEQLVRGWVDFYTGWVSAETAERRRAEIHSDLWEQQAYARETGAPRIAVSLSLTRRAVTGAPADLLWVHKERAAARSLPAQQKAREMNSVQRFALRWWWALGAAVLAAVGFTMSIGQLLQPGMPYLDGTIHAFVASALVASGIVLRARLPRVATALTVGGAFSFAALWWAPVVMVIGIAVVIGAGAEFLRLLTPRDAVRTSLAVGGLLAIGIGPVGLGWAGFDAGVLGLGWLVVAAAGAAILIVVGDSRSRIARVGAATA
jgi:hypothetical protein